MVQIAVTEKGGIWHILEDGEVCVQVKELNQGEVRVGYICGTPEDLLELDYKAGQELHGRIQRIESTEPIIEQYPEAYRVSDNLWRCEVYAPHMEPDQLIVNQNR